MKTMAALLCALLVWTVSAAAEEPVVCNGDINSVQGEGLIARPQRFEVWNISGADVSEVLEKCVQIAADRQAKLFRKNGSIPFRKQSEVNLVCKKGAEQLQVKRSITVNR